MEYKVIISQKANKNLNKIDKAQRLLILKWINKNLAHTQNPKQFGKPLSGNLKDYWRYRIGDYRIIAEIDNDEIKIIILNIGHRKNIYD